MTAQDSGRPPAAAFHTVTDPEQARLLSDPESFRFFEPFVARACSVKAAAAEVGCSLSTMLYRVKTFLGAGLLQVARIEKRAGRPIKHYRSAFDAYFIPFEVTPYAGLEERLEAYYRERQKILIPAGARLLRTMGTEGRRLYRRLDDGEVWQESAGDTQTFIDFYDTEAYARRLEARRGPLGEMMDDTLHLTEVEAKALLLEFHALWWRYAQGRPHGEESGRPYFMQFNFLPLEP
jgi:hypothetical protein